MSEGRSKGSGLPRKERRLGDSTGLRGRGGEDGMSDGIHD